MIGFCDQNKNILVSRAWSHESPQTLSLSDSHLWNVTFAICASVLTDCFCEDGLTDSSLSLETWQTLKHCAAFFKTTRRDSTTLESCHGSNYFINCLDDCRVNCGIRSFCSPACCWTMWHFIGWTLCMSCINAVISLKWMRGPVFSTQLLLIMAYYSPLLHHHQNTEWRTIFWKNGTPLAEFRYL